MDHAQDHAQGHARLGAFGDLSPWGRAGRVWSLAWPTVLTMTSATLMQFVDSVMVSQLGGEALAAQGNGGVWAWTATSFLMGVITLVNTFVSQCVGRGDTQRAARYAWCGVWFGVLSWLAFLVPLAVWGLPAAFALMGHDPDILRLETGYGRILLLGTGIALAGKAIGNFFFAIGRPKVVTVAAVIGNVVNVLLNYAFIYGEPGLPNLIISILKRHASIHI